jgi:thiol-disulfide isomerase/thioredoxin
MKILILLMCLLLFYIDPSNAGISLQNKDSFTIIGKTKGFKDGSMLYLRRAESGHLSDNLDSACVINNSFTFTGTVSEPAPYTIHTGYTGWNGQPPETFHRLDFWINNSTIYINDGIGDLKLAKISGSQLQNDNNDLIQAISPLYSTLDSIGRIIEELTPADSVRNRELRTKFRKLNSERFNSEISFIKTHPKSIISIYWLNIYKQTLGKDTSKELYVLMDPQIRNSADGVSIKQYIGFPDPITVGYKFTDIGLPDLNGKLIKLSSLKNKFILLEFWAGWCGPCRLENPRLLTMYNKYKPKGFEIYGVSLDTKREGWQNAVNEDKINWITVSDLKGSNYSEAASVYNVQGVPSNFLINKKGIIIAQDIRGEQLETKLKEIFKE